MIAANRMVAGLGAATVLLGGFAFYAQRQEADLRGGATVRNVALTDNARTSEVKGAVTEAVNAAFSYSYTDPAKSQNAAKAAFTGKAVQQYDALFAKVRQEGPAQKLVLTTAVTESAVQSLRGDRARLLVFADQRNTSASDGKSASSAAMLAVDAQRRAGHWRITALDTFSG
ncbi:hypothetical protein [Actinomadura macrotermitis]|uniref:Mce-associated membrane protein n=1 Tax=Actinomadura macrotermitis TaxID=2585200 RepID=A0A7K0BS78_9ACTN|nr:hypothetical protein [Actinomadura macrotermitis]MQY04053.1 hypothetical protein [Actinomadura macrotermitis]